MQRISTKQGNEMEFTGKLTLIFFSSFSFCWPQFGLHAVVRLCNSLVWPLTECSYGIPRLSQ